MASLFSSGKAKTVQAAAPIQAEPEKKPAGAFFGAGGSGQLGAGSTNPELTRSRFLGTT